MLLVWRQETLSEDWAALGRLAGRPLPPLPRLNPRPAGEAGPAPRYLARLSSHALARLTHLYRADMELFGYQ